MRLIDADALKERLEQISVVADDMYGMGINRGLDRADTAIDEAPTVDIKTEVAREIFAEISRNIPSFATVYQILEVIKEVRNKYTKECENNG